MSEESGLTQVSSSRRVVIGSMIVAVVSVVIAVAALLVATSRGSGETSASSPAAIPTPPTSATAATDTTQAPETVPASTEIPVEELLAQASNEWSTQTARLGSEVVVSNVALVNGVPTAASTTEPSMGQTVALWAYGDAGYWEISTESANAGWTFDYVDALALTDVTADDSAELVVSWFPNAYVGDVFSLDGGAWEEIGGGQALRVKDGELAGIENLCVPSCSAGFNVNYKLVWNGTGFTTQYFDPYGSPIELSVPVACQTYTARAAFGPYRPCDKGDGVALIQEALVFWGFIADGPDSSDGYFGQTTADGVRLAQLWFGVPVDGIVSSDFYDTAFLGYLNGFDLPPPTQVG